MSLEIAFFVAVTVMDLSAAAIIFAGALSERMRLYPTWHKVGLMVACMGLVAQALRNVQFIYTGISPSDDDTPLWVLKDGGIAIIAYFYLFLAVQRHRNPEPIKPPVRRKRTIK